MFLALLFFIILDAYLIVQSSSNTLWVDWFKTAFSNELQSLFSYRFNQQLILWIVWWNTLWSLFKAFVKKSAFFGIE